MLEIQTAKLSSRKRVLIDGTEFTVRKLGAGDELALSQIIRRTQELLKKAEKNNDLTDKEQADLLDMHKQSLAIYASTFDDGGDGSKSMQLVEKLSYEERTLLYKQIWNVEEKADNAPSEGTTSQTEES